MNARCEACVVKITQWGRSTLTSDELEGLGLYGLIGVGLGNSAAHFEEKLTGSETDQLERGLGVVAGAMAGLLVVVEERTLRGEVRVACGASAGARLTGNGLARKKPATRGAGIIRRPKTDDMPPFPSC